MPKPRVFLQAVLAAILVLAAGAFHPAKAADPKQARV
jgi:hypothetical protein